MLDPNLTGVVPVEPGLADLRGERIAFVGHGFEAAADWDRRQQLAMTPDERRAVAKALRDRVYGTRCPDLREAERLRDGEHLSGDVHLPAPTLKPEA